MDIFVCVKQIPDPEIPPAKFRLDTAAKKVVPPDGVPPVISVFDERAMEAALRLKEQAGAKITAITMGPESAKDVVRHALAMGADEGVILQADPSQGWDSFVIAQGLTEVIKKLGHYDLILCGRQAADWDTGQVGYILAENLGIPVVSLARKAEVSDGKIKVERVTSDGYEVVEVSPPALVTVSQEIGLPRLPSGFGIITAARKPLKTFTAAELGLELSRPPQLELLRLFIPERQVKCEFIEAESGAEAGAKLVERLAEAKIL